MNCWDRKDRGKNIYFHLVGGSSGDMLLSSLIGLGCPLTYLKEEFKKLNVNFHISEKRIKNPLHFPKKKLSFNGERFIYYKDIVKKIKLSRLDKDIKDKVLNVYGIIADAERKIHRDKTCNLHFHHLGEIDALLESIGFFIGLKYLNIEKTYVSSFPLSLPAPATLEILKGKRINPVDYAYETVTPTGAALLKDAEHLQQDFSFIKSSMAWGHCGEKDYLVAYIFEGQVSNNKIVKVEANIDDMNPQIFESLFDILYEKGAKEVYIEQVIMKKSRPAFVLNVLCSSHDLSRIKEEIFRRTTTFGIRYNEYLRDKLPYKFIYKNTKLGRVKHRVSPAFKKETPEYEDCLKIAKKLNIPLLEVYDKL